MRTVATIILFTLTFLGALAMTTRNDLLQLRFLAIIAAILAHDAYFYWTHRALHTPILWRVHRLHHSKRNTVAMDSLLMSPGEAIIEAAFFPLAAFLLTPLELSATFVFVMATNTLAHMCWATHRPWPRWLTFVLNSPAHHRIHHFHPQANFGAYLRMWDILCGSADKHNLQKHKVRLHLTNPQHKLSRSGKITCKP